MPVLPAAYTLSVVSVHGSSGKSSLCKRLIDSNIDNYRSFLSAHPSELADRTSSWFYWGSIKHRRLDEKREAIFHFVEHSSASSSESETFDTYLKRLATLTFRFDDKIPVQTRTYPKEKITVDGFLCVYDLSSNKPLADFLLLLHALLKTRRSILVVTTKNDLLDQSSKSTADFERSIHSVLPSIPIIHTSALEHVNIQSVLELALYTCDEANRKSTQVKYQPPNYVDGYKNEQSLKHIIQTEYRALLSRHVPEFRIGTWEKFYDRWQHHTCVQTFNDMFGKEQAQCLYNEHLDELRRISRQKLIDERLIPIVEMLMMDQKGRIPRNWDFVRVQMQKHPRYTSTVIPTSLWSDAERTHPVNPSCLTIPDDLLDTYEARQRFESYLHGRQLEQTRRSNCRSFFDLLNRFSDAGLVHYGDSYDKDCVYFLGRECYESLNSQDRLRVFAFHQSYLYRLLCLEFVELLFESLEIFINTFDKMNLATKLNSDNHVQSRKITTVTIDEIFQKEIIQQIKHDPRYRSLNKRETDRHRLIMCHCHFLYDCIYYRSIHVNRSFKQRKRSFKRRKSSSISSYNHLSIDDNFCPYTRQIPTSAHDDNDLTGKKKLDITCPMEQTCADVRILDEIASRIKLKNTSRTMLICGDDDEMDQCVELVSDDGLCVNGYQINLIRLNDLTSQSIDGCLFLSANGQQRLRDLILEKKCSLNIDDIPSVNSYADVDEDSTTNIPNEMTIEQVRSSVEQLLFNADSAKKRSKLSDLRLLVCFMCGGGSNDIEVLVLQLASRFSLTVLNSSSVMITVSLEQSYRKIELALVSFHSLFAMKLAEFDGFILLYDRERKAAMNTVTYLEKHLLTTFHREPTNKDADEKRSETPVIRPPIYSLCCVKDSSLSTIRKSLDNGPHVDYSLQCHQGTIRNFVECHLSLFLKQCWNEKYQQITDHGRSEELLAGVQSFFELERSRLPLVNSDRVPPLILSSKSSEHSPKHRPSSLTPTNSTSPYRSYPHLSHSTHGGDATIVATTPVDPLVTHPSLVSSSSISTASMSDSQHQYFQKSTSMRFAKLIEHPTDGSSYQSSTSSMSTGMTSAARRRYVDTSSSEEIKFLSYKTRSSAQVKVPLATPEVVEFNELISKFCSAEPASAASSPILADTRDSLSHDPPKQSRTTDSSLDSSIDDRLRPRRESFNSNTQATNGGGLQRKPSDRKIKRVRGKPNEAAAWLTSSNEILKKPGSDDDNLQDNEAKHLPQSHTKKKQRPSFKRRKKNSDQTHTDSGIESRVDSKDSNKINPTSEPSSVTIVSNEEDSSVGDYTRNSNHVSIEELEERPAASWIRRQIGIFAQIKRDKSESKPRASVIAMAGLTFSPFKHSLTSNLHGSSETSSHRVPVRLILSRCPLGSASGVPMFIEKCIAFVEEHGLKFEGLYRVSGFKNQVDLVIHSLSQDPTCDLNALKVSPPAVATAFKDMMRKLDEPILSLEQFNECQTQTVDQLREQQFVLIQQALLRVSDLKYRANRAIFKHLHLVSHHAALTHMDSSNLAVLWWPNLFQPQFHDLRTAEQICQKAKPLIQTIIDNYPIIFSSDQTRGDD